MNYKFWVYIVCSRGALIEPRNPTWEDLAEKWGAAMVFAAESIRER
jgi:hypothetical protein